MNEQISDFSGVIIGSVPDRVVCVFKAMMCSAIKIDVCEDIVCATMQYYSILVCLGIDRLQHGPRNVILSLILGVFCNKSQPIPNILAHIFFRKIVESNFGPITKISGPFKKIDYFSLTARSQQKRTMLVCIPTYFCPIFFHFFYIFFCIFEAIRATAKGQHHSSNSFYLSSTNHLKLGAILR